MKEKFKMPAYFCGADIRNTFIPNDPLYFPAVETVYAKKEDVEEIKKILLQILDKLNEKNSDKQKTSL